MKLLDAGFKTTKWVFIFLLLLLIKVKLNYSVIAIPKQYSVWIFKPFLDLCGKLKLYCYIQIKKIPTCFKTDVHTCNFFFK